VPDQSRSACLYLPHVFVLISIFSFSCLVWDPPKSKHFGPKTLHTIYLVQADELFMSRELEWREVLSSNGVLHSDDAILVADYGNVSNLTSENKDASVSHPQTVFEPGISPRGGVTSLSKQGILTADMLGRIREHWRLERERCVAFTSQCFPTI
jgi:hypothetical protein